jgi:hypothetical protein
MGNTGTPVIPDKIKGQVLDKLENPSDSSIKIDKLPASAYDNADEVPPTIN